MINGLGYEAACCMVLRLLCMMINALRCAGIVYLPGMTNLLHCHILCISLLHSHRADQCVADASDIHVGMSVVVLLQGLYHVYSRVVPRSV